MSFGEQLKSLRQAKGLSQPELSERAGIEQSYLSKLENNKSTPSNEIFRSLLIALDLELTEFVAGISQDKIRQNFSQIPDIEYWLKQQDKQDSMYQRYYLYVSSAFIVLAVTLFYIGASKLIFTETRYQYESVGVILPGEPKEIYSNWMALIPTTIESRRSVIDKKRVEIEQRRDEEVYLTHENLGKSFVIDVKEGTRVFRLDKDEQVPRAINAWLQVIGVFLFTLGTIGFLLERRLYSTSQYRCIS